MKYKNKNEKHAHSDSVSPSVFVDQMGRKLVLEKTPQRIISLVPSQTEFLYDLGLGDKVVGITKFCIHPDSWFRSKTRVGGTKNVDLEKVRSLNPDLIIGNKEENTEADILELEKIAPVWMSDIYTFEDAFEMMLSIGELCGREEKANAIVQEIRQKTSTFAPLKGAPTAMYLIWNEPLMAAAKETFIHEVLTAFGFRNYYENQTRYPLCDAAQKPHPDYILLSSEPFPFEEKHKIEIAKKYPDSKIVFVDGEFFSWYGSRMLLLADYFESLNYELQNL